MKGSIVAAAAALFGNAAAVHVRNVHGHAHAHELFQKRDEALCTTYFTTITGSMTWYPTPGVSSNKTVVPTTAANNYTTKAVPTTTSIATTPSTTSTTVQLTTSTSVAPVTVTSVATVVTVPTLVVETCSTTGTYTFPSTTVVVTETTTVCGAQTTPVTSGTNTIGGVTTVVETATTVVCPYATASTQPGGVVTSILATTTYVCPSAGTYTIAPITTVVTTDTVVVCPVVATFTPGTYTKPAVTTTVTETDIVVYCPFATSSASTSTVPAVTVPAVTTTAVPVAETTTAVATPATTSVAVEVSTVKASASTSATKSASTSVPALGGGSQWAITYTPYTTSGECKSASAVLSDIAAVKEKGFTTVRVYSTDCDTLPNVGAACSTYGLKMIIGVFIGEVGCDNSNPDVASQIASIKSWGKWDLVELVVVGNEAGNDGYCTPSELSSLIVEVKEIVSEAGASCPVTTTDTVNTWQNTEFSSAICSVVDVVACNAHAYFNAETTPAKAGDFVQGQLDIVKEICGLEGYVLETGWPSECVANGVATCSAEDQATAIASLKEVVGGSVVFFSFSDDEWKEDGTCGCEQHWGCGQLF